MEKKQASLDIARNDLGAGELTPFAMPRSGRPLPQPVLSNVLEPGSCLADILSALPTPPLARHLRSVPGKQSAPVLLATFLPWLKVDS